MAEIGVFRRRYRGLTGMERPVYAVAMSFGLSCKPDTSRNGKCRLKLSDGYHANEESLLYMANPAGNHRA